jgi:hypothetical protein
VSQDTEQRPARPPVSASRRHGGHFALLALAALLAVRLPLPWMALAVLIVVAADIEGIRAARAIVREGQRRTLLTWCVVGLALLTLIGLGAVGTLALYPITYDRQECLAGANTEVAKAQCQSDFDRRITRLQDSLLGR